MLHYHPDENGPTQSLMHSFTDNCFCRQIDPYKLVEWFEVNKVLGVTEFNVYCNHVDETSLKALYFYQNEGILNLHFVPTPHYEDTRNGNVVSSALSLNDCMYRNIYRYKWMVVVDLDEIIIPKKAHNYHDLIQDIKQYHKLDSSKDPGTYIFRNEYFYVGCDFPMSAADENGPRKSIMMRHFHRLPANRFLYTPKSFHSMMHCEAVFNHYCLHKLKGKQPPAHQLDVNATIGTNHHYRKTYSQKNCQETKLKAIVDRTLYRFRKKAGERYEEVLTKLGL